jgi:two-component system, OmpR family, response regulator ResD
MVDLRKRTILIVEDEADLRTLYKEVLEDSGYAVEEAGDGITALKKIQEVPWDLLLLDIMLPGKDGVKIVKEMADHPGWKKGPVVALTNLNSEALIREVFAGGADGYLIKSEITPDKVVAEAENYLK